MGRVGDLIAERHVVARISAAIAEVRLHAVHGALERGGHCPLYMRGALTAIGQQLLGKITIPPSLIEMSICNLAHSRMKTARAVRGQAVSSSSGKMTCKSISVPSPPARNF